MTDNSEGKTETIKRLNDQFRHSFEGGRVMVTAGVDALGHAHVRHLLGLVRTFNNFSPDNDPHGEHDFGALDYDGERYFWKIDYYARDLQTGSEDPADPNKTVRILTVLRADEY